MQQARNKLQLQAHEDEVLRTLYRDFNIPTDQYPQRPDDLVRLVENWNSLTGRREAPPDVLHYMITFRKNGGWEKLGRNAGGAFSRPRLKLTDEEMAELDAIHAELQIASDNFALNSDLAQRLQHEFGRRTGKIVPAMILAAEMISRRKAGALATLKPHIKEAGVAFKDINEVAS